MTSPIRAVVVDFDGTIVAQDVSEEILRAFGAPEWWDIDLEFQRGEIGCRECLVRQGALLTGTRASFLDLAVERFRVDPTFGPFVAWARSRGIEVVVASDGFGFYVEPMLAAAGVHGLRVLTNGFTMEDDGPSFSFPNGHPRCVGCGTCKMNVVLGLRSGRGRVAFVGEGHSDRYGALYADLVFAKKHLVEVCRADGVPFEPWEDFDDVMARLEEGVELRSDPGPMECPGWTEPGEAGYEATTRVLPSQLS
jgi:2-hydroxy-3-keto-5-methylthiopentenyl-1-phosphate phosphatase